MIASMFGSSKSGFGLLEIVVTLAIIALVGTVVVPLVRRTDPALERRNVISQLNILVALAQQQAIITGKEHKVEFDKAALRVRVFRASDKRDSEGKTVFVPVTGVALSPEMSWPKHLDIKQFFVEGFDEMTRFLGTQTARVWFYVMPDGIAQSVIINLFDTKDTLRGSKRRSVGLVLNPFSAQFKAYDTFQQ